MKRVALYLAFGASIWAKPALSQTIVLHPASTPGVDQAVLRRVDTLVNGYVARGWIRGAVALVVRDGKVVKYQGYGRLDTAGRVPMPADALFRICSQTKAIVSVGAMTLWEEGKFYLDEPIADFIPEFRHPVVLDKFHAADTTYTTVPARREITFRDLLTHMSGLDYPVIGTPDMQAIYAKAGIPSGLGDFNCDLLERVRTLARLPLVHQPGEKWTYSLSVDVLGALIQVMTHESLEEFLTRRIFRPLGMADTYFNVPASKGDRLAAVYTQDGSGHIIPWPKGLYGVDPAYPLEHMHYFSGGAGLTSTALDYAIFLQMLLDGGTYNGVRILSRRTVEMMTSGQLDGPFNGIDNFGLGFEITGERSAAREPRNAGSFSWGGYFGTTYWADPKARLVGCFMMQQTPNNHWDVEKKFEDVVYAALK